MHSPLHSTCCILNRERLSVTNLSSENNKITFSELKLVTDNLSLFMQQPTEKPLKENCCILYCIYSSIIRRFILTVESRKYAPPFATLALYKTQGGGAYTRDATISRVVTPSFPEKGDFFFFFGRTFDLVSGQQRICACAVPHPLCT